MVCPQVFSRYQGGVATAVSEMANTQISPSGVLIAGPARCGKSTLAAALAKVESDIAVITVEALFPAFRSTPVPAKPDGQKDFIHRYLMRTRYMDSAKIQTRRPIDDMGGDVETIVQNVNAPPGTSAIGLIAASLGSWAKSVGARAWVAPDLHAELYFERFTKSVPDIGIIVLLRDPRAAIAASLYWRTYPECAQAPTRMLLHKLLLWCLSAETGRRLAEKTDGRVSTIFIENLLGGTNASEGGSIVGVPIPPPPAFPSKQLYFSYVESDGWLAPDGTWKQLLGKREQRLIERLSRPWFDAPAFNSGGDLNDEIIFLGVRTLLVVILGVGRLNPGLAKTLLDAMFYPVARASGFIRNTLTSVRRRSFG